MFGYSAREYLHPQVVIEWTTASELDTVGFNILRAESEGGETTRINPEMIAPSPDPLTGGDYSFTDTTVRAGVTYYYYLEDLDAQGGSTRNGPQVVTATQSGLLEGGLALVLCAVAAYGFFTAGRKTVNA